MKTLSKLGFFTLGFVGTLTVATALKTHNNSSQDSVFQKEAFVTPSAAVNTDQFTVKHLDLANGRVIYLTEEVTPKSSDDVITQIIAANETSTTKPIYLLLDSPGGSVPDGERIITAIQNSKAPIYSVNINMAASMAALISQYTVKRYAVPRAILMFHPASLEIGFRGELDKLSSRVSFYKRGIDKMDVHVAKRAGMTYEAFKALSTRELWIDSEDALENHYIDAIVDVTINPVYKLKTGENKLIQEIKLTM